MGVAQNRAKMGATPDRPRPFLKWAGGKTWLLKQFDQYLTRLVQQGRIRRYIEPFVGSGAVFWHMACVYRVPELVICDGNDELIRCYRALREDVEGVIAHLERLVRRYHATPASDQASLFYAVRQQFNVSRPSARPSAPLPIAEQRCGPAWVERAAQTIFLNHTCYNGLFRVNSRGEFNVPFGRYKNPGIYDAGNLRRVAGILQHTTIVQGDFTRSAAYVDPASFVYFDPPYRPISKTASFTAYAKSAFNDDDQRRLAAFFRELDAAGASLMLSNSDPTSLNPDDHFFEELYQGYRIERVMAARAINSRADKRGKVPELLITNYEIPISS